MLQSTCQKKVCITRFNLVFVFIPTLHFRGLTYIAFIVRLLCCLDMESAEKTHRMFGLTSFLFIPFCQLLDMKVFVDTDSDIRLIRRLKRDISQRGRDISGIIKQYNKFVKPAFEQYIEPTVQAADIVVPRGQWKYRLLCRNKTVLFNMCTLYILLDTSATGLLLVQTMYTSVLLLKLLCSRQQQLILSAALQAKTTCGKM